MKMKKIYVTPAAKILVAETADFCVGSTGTEDAFGNRIWFDEEDEEEVKLPKPKNLWKD